MFAADDKAWIPVPFQSQLDTGCKKNNWCCGLAAANMGTAYLGEISPTKEYLKKMYEYLGKNSCCSGGTYPEEQLDAAINIGNAENSYEDYLSWDDLKAEIRNGHPVIVGLKYSYIKTKCSTFNGYHSVLVIGYNSTKGYWVVNDPLCSSSSNGRNKQIPSSEFRKACEAYSGYSDHAYCVVLSD